MKDILIVSNNDKVIGKYLNHIKVNGTHLNVLLKVRDLVHKGYSLISHPLPASIRMFYSPVRSILVKLGSDTKSLTIIEDALENYKRTLGKRQEDKKNLGDYEKIDLILLESAIFEYNGIEGN